VFAKEAAGSIEREISMKVVIAALMLFLCSAASAATNPAYTLSQSIALGTPDRWDYVVYDGQTNRVYVAHSDRLAVIDAYSEGH
jgi:hypothetical protein